MSRLKIAAAASLTRSSRRSGSSPSGHGGRIRPQPRVRPHGSAGAMKRPTAAKASRGAGLAPGDRSRSAAGSSIREGRPVAGAAVQG